MAPGARSASTLSLNILLYREPRRVFILGVVAAWNCSTNGWLWFKTEWNLWVDKICGSANHVNKIRCFPCDDEDSVDGFRLTTCEALLMQFLCICFNRRWIWSLLRLMSFVGGLLDRNRCITGKFGCGGAWSNIFRHPLFMQNFRQKSPCAEPCAEPYGFKHQMTLTTNTEKFKVWHFQNKRYYC